MYDLFFIAGLILSAAIGLSLGLIGGGGSIITVPVLVYVIGVDVRESIGISLVVVGSTSLVGAALHYRRGTLRVGQGLLFGAAGIAGAFLGVPLTRLVAPATLLLIFALLMLMVATLMLVRRQGEDAETLSHRGGQKITGALLAGFVVGVLTGFLGVGGGFLIVPTLVLFGGLAMKEAVGTSLLVIAINCAAGLIGHLRYGGFDPQITMLVTTLAVAGALAGTHLSHRVSSAGLRKIFALFVIMVALFLVVKNYSALFPP